MKTLSEMLKDPQASGVYSLQELVSVETLRKLANELGLAFFYIEGQHISDKDQFLKQAALILRFPAYFGDNWDAFADCLSDMSWHEADGFVILYDHFAALAKHSPSEFETARDIFKESTEFWRNQGKALLVLLHGRSVEGSELPKVKL